jgi:hypothetical protein
MPSGRRSSDVPRVLQLRESGELRQHERCPPEQLRHIGILRRVLGLRLAEPRPDLHLARLPEQRDAGDRQRRTPQPVDPIGHRCLALCQRLEIDLQAAGVDGRIRAGPGGHRADVRIGLHALNHGGVRNVLGRFGGALYQTIVLLRKEALSPPPGSAPSQGDAGRFPPPRRPRSHALPPRS